MVGERPPISYSEQNPDDQERQFRSSQHENAGFLEIASKLALLGFGAHIFTRHALGFDLVSRAAHLMGRFYDSGYLIASGAGRFSRKSAYGVPKAIRSYINQRGRIGSQELDLHRYISNNLDLLSAPSADANAQIRTRLLRESLEKRYAQSIDHHFDESLRRISIDEVLGTQREFFKSILKEQFDVLEKGAKSGIIKRDWILDKDIYINKVTKRIVDARMKDPRFAVKSAIDLFNPFGIFNPIRALLDEPGVARISPRQMLSKGTRVGPGEHLYVFGDVYKLQLGRAEKLDLPFKVLPVRAGTMMHKAMADTVGQSVYKKPPNTFWGRLQQKMGIGPFYRTRNPLIATVLARPFSAAVARRQGKAVPKLFEFLPEERAGLFSDIMASQGIITESTEAVARDGAGIVRNPYQSLNEMRFFRGKAGRGIMERFSAASERRRILSGQSSRYGALFKTGSVQQGTDIARPVYGHRLTRGDLFYNIPTGARKGVDFPFGHESALSPRIQRAYDVLRDPSSSEATIQAATRDMRTTSVGRLSPQTYAQYNFFSPFSVLKGGANYLAIRLNELIGTTAGIGFRPSSSVLANYARIAAIPFGALALFRTGQYVDWQTERLTGVSPTKLAATGYVQARIAQQEAREQTGLGGVFRKTEEIMPGFLESGFGFLLRHGIIAGASLAAIKKINPLAGLLVGFAGYATIGGISVGQTPKEIREEYVGARFVPVRKARWWGFGRSEFTGGRVEHHTLSWYQKLMRQPEMYGIYGGPGEYFSKYANVFGVPFPTPESMFGLRQLLDPYALSRKHYYDRPYPTTGGMFDEFPVFGVALNETIGQVLKPRLKMHPEETQGFMGVHTNIYNTHLPVDAARRMGVAPLPITSLPVAGGGSLRERIDRGLQSSTEIFGLYKFGAEQVGLINRPTYLEADAGLIGSSSRSFYNAQLGGLAGHTELIRRFLLSEFGNPSKIRHFVNPIRNTMPSWLPGIGSRYTRDQFAWTDFSTGDPYTKTPSGETRLPGPGYERLHGLHSGISGVYSPVDRFLVLSSVAPFSEAYLDYKIQVLGMLERGDLDSFWETRIRSALEQVEKRKTRFEYYPRRFTKEASLRSHMLDFKASLATANIANQYTGFERTLGAGWEVLSHDVLANIPYFGAKFAPFYSPLEHYEKFQLYGSETALWNQPWSDIIRPAFHETISAPPPVAALKGAGLGFIMGSAMSPMSVINPFPMARTPALVGLGAFLGSAGSWTRRIFTGGAYSGGYIPAHVQNERELEEYFDKLRYTRARIFQERARQIGDNSLASAYGREVQSTYSGMHAGSSKRQMRRALSRRERAYFDAFTEAPDYMKPGILGVVSPGAGSVYQKVWGMEGPLSRKLQEDTDRLAIEYFQRHVVPNSKSPVWHPSVPMQSIKAAYLDSGINGVADSFSKFDVYPRTLLETRARFPELQDIAPADMTQSLLRSINNAISNAINPFNNRIMQYSNMSFFDNSMDLTLYNDQPDKYIYMQDMMRQ